MEPEAFNRIIDAIVSREIPNAGQRTLLGYSIGEGLRWPSWSIVLKPGTMSFVGPGRAKQSPFYAITVHTRLGRWAWFWMTVTSNGC